MKDKTNYKLNVFVIGAAVALCACLAVSVQPAFLSSTLGLNIYASKKVIDIISAAGSIWAVVGIVASVIGGGGIGVAILASAKALAQRYGKAAAAAW